jgi:hypothetical protein
MGCKKRVFRNNQIRFDTLPDKSWYRSQKNRMPFWLTNAVAELQQEVEVLQLPLETFGIAEGEAKPATLPRSSAVCSSIYPGSKNWPRKF